MTRTQRALERLARAAEGRGTASDALIAGGVLRYLRTRTLRFSANRLFSAVLHVVEVVVLAGSLPPRALVLAVAVRHGVAVLEAGWWGALEPYRRRLRELTGQGRLRSRDELVRRLRHRSVWLGGVVLVVALAALGHGILDVSRSRDGVADVFAAIVIGRLAIDLPLRGFHSTVLALRRVWRPGWSFWGPDLLQLMVLLGAVPVVGVWGVPLAALSSTLSGSVLSWWYTRRAWQSLRLEPTRRPTRMDNAGVGGAGNVVWHGVGWASSRAASMAVLTVAVAPVGPDDFLVALCIFLAAPLLDAVAGQANLYYVDLARLTLPRWLHLRRRLVRLMMAGALGFAVASGACALLLARGFTGPHFGAVALPLALLFAVRAPLAVVAVARFTAGEPQALVLGSLGLVVGTLVGGLLSWSAPAALVLGTVVSTLVTWRWPSSRVRGEAQPSLVLIELGGLPRQRVPALAAGLSFPCVGVGDRCLVGVLGGQTPPSRAELVAELGGLARDLVVLPAATGLSAAPERWRRRLDGPDRRGVQESFAATFPDGVCVDVHSTTGAASALPRQDRGRLLRAADRFLNEGQPSEGGRTEVTAWAPGGTVEVLFVVSRHAPAHLRRDWARQLAVQNALSRFMPVTRAT